MGKKFAHEKFYDQLKEMVGQDTDDLEVLLKPYLEMFRERASYLKKNLHDLDLFQQIRTKFPEKAHRYDDYSWVELFPFLLPPHQVNHTEAAAYMTYRIYETGNIIYSVSKHLTEAFFRTDYKIDFDQINFPHKTFIVYWGDGDHSVKINSKKEKCPILSTFVDLVDMGNGLVQLRQVYNYIDEDGDLANSGITTLTMDPEHKSLDSEEFYKTIWETDYSILSDMKVPEEHRYNSYVTYQLLWNLILYLNNVDDRVVYRPSDDFARLNRLSNPSKRRKLQKRLAEQSPYRYTYIGSAYDRRVEGIERGNRQRPLQHSTVVRGHWRNQWIGPRKDSAGRQIPGTHQKLIWIEPFVKGKDKGEPEKTLVYRVV